MSLWAVDNFIYNNIDKYNTFVIFVGYCNFFIHERIKFCSYRPRDCRNGRAEFYLLNWYCGGQRLANRRDEELVSSARG